MQKKVLLNVNCWLVDVKKDEERAVFRDNFLHFLKIIVHLMKKAWRINDDEQF